MYNIRAPSYGVVSAQNVLSIAVTSEKRPVRVRTALNYTSQRCERVLASSATVDPSGPRGRLENPPPSFRARARSAQSQRCALPTEMARRSCLVLPAKTLTDIPGFRIDGLIGTDVLKHYALLVDFQQRLLTFWQGGRLSARQREATGFRSPYSVPILELADSSNYAVAVGLDGKQESPFTVDTGSWYTTVPKEVTTQLQWTPLGLGELGGPAYGVFSAVGSIAHSLSIRGVTVTGTEIMSPEKDTVKLPAYLGLNVLSQYQLLLDYPQRTLYFQRLHLDRAKSL